MASHSRALSSVGRAPDLHSGGQEFDSPSVHQILKVPWTVVQGFFVPIHSVYARPLVGYRTDVLIKFNAIILGLLVIECRRLLGH